MLRDTKVNNDDIIILENTNTVSFFFLSWVPEITKYCYGLLGALVHTRYAKILQFYQPGIILNDVKCYHEAKFPHKHISILDTYSRVK